MNTSRRSFLGGIAAGAALAAMPGCCTKVCKATRPGKIALQLYSLNKWIPAQDPVGKVALAKALKKINTNVDVEENGDMGAIDISGEDA